MVSFSRSLALAGTVIAVAWSGTATASTLFNQTLPTNLYENRYVSNDFEATYDAYDSAIVEDFTLSTAAHLTSVQAGLIGLSNAGFQGFDRVDGYTLNIFSSAAAAYGSLTGDVYSTFIRGTLADYVGSIQTLRDLTEAGRILNIPIDLDLGAGTYYLSVVASNSLDFNGEVGIATYVGTGGNNAVIANPGQGFNQGNPIGLGRDAVYAIQGTAAVPEPATWAMMLLGFGAVGGALRRRQKVVTRIRFA